MRRKTVESAKRILKDALNLKKSGVFSVVLKYIPMELAKEITDRVSKLTIRIGVRPRIYIQFSNKALGHKVDRHEKW